MSTDTVPAGWHPDPANPLAGMRWWDGMRWTEHTRARTDVAGSAPGAVSPWGARGAHAYQVPTRPAGRGAPRVQAQRQAGFARRNSYSLATLAVAAAYVLAAFTGTFVALGILPVGLALRALRRHETLAPAALVAAAVAVAVAVLTLLR